MLALRATKTTDDMLYLCDNQALLKAVQKWTGDGPKQTMVNAPDADILREIIELLKARVATGAATFLIKVKAHRGEPLRAVCRKEYSGKSDKEVEGTSLRKGLSSAPGGAGESASVDAINRRRTHGVERWHTKW